MKKTLASIGMIALFHMPVLAENASLESKIKVIDDQIRQEEQQQSHNAKKLQELVSEYNKLVQEHASAEQKDLSTSNPEQTHEEAILQRLKEHEQRIDQLEETVATLLVNSGLPPMSAAASSLPTDTAALPAKTVGAVVTTTTGVPIEKHAADNVATEKVEAGPTPLLDTQSPALAQFNQAMALLNAGLKRNNKEDLKKATEAFELITTTYPDDAYANKSYVHAGDAHLKLANMDEAQKFYKIAITKPLDRQNAIRARLGYGETHLAQKNNDDACAQVKALAKEKLDAEQLKRFDTLKTNASCGVIKSDTDKKSRQ